MEEHKMLNALNIDLEYKHVFDNFKVLDGTISPNWPLNILTTNHVTGQNDMYEMNDTIYWTEDIKSSDAMILAFMSAILVIA